MGNSSVSYAGQYPRDQPDPQAPLPGDDDEETPITTKDAKIRLLGSVIQSRLGSQHTRHFVVQIKVPSVAQSLDLMVGDELLVLDNKSLMDVPHNLVVRRLYRINNSFTLLIRRLNPAADGLNRYQYMLLRGSPKGGRKSKQGGVLVESMETRPGGAKFTIPLTYANRYGVLVKSVSHPTKGIKGNHYHMYVDNVTGGRGGNQMDLLYYLCWPPRSDGQAIAALVRSPPNVYMKALPDMRITSEVGGVDLNNPPRDRLFWATPTSSPYTVSFTPCILSGVYVRTDGTPNLSLHRQPGHPDVLFDVL